MPSNYIYLRNIKNLCIALNFFGIFDKTSELIHKT